MSSLAGKKALLIGIAHEESVAFGCATAFQTQGVDLAITYRDDKSVGFVRPLAEKLATDVLLHLDMRNDMKIRRLDRRGQPYPGATSTSHRRSEA
ncbi:SDR family oxidoreductase [Bradyrhizobium sp. HKCCYLS1011]|uniref:SDR family oxidoreductase n=1 Tax=Bradyrhizobium sp. HKCCYLS1011 TaxID=3420733 RepID=UPI003EBB9028